MFFKNIADLYSAGEVPVSLLSLMSATAIRPMTKGTFVKKITAWLIIISGAAGFVAFSPEASFSKSPTSAPLSAPENPLQPEKNPPGDIPDNQVFIEYQSPLGFAIKVPEGWARRQISEGVSFSDKYNTIELAISQRATPLTVDSVKQNEISELERAGKAVRVTSVKAKQLPSGNAIVVSYGSNSESNPVTNKAIRLENERNFFLKGGKLVTLTLSAPFGADNTDQWQLMAKSFRWR